MFSKDNTNTGGESLCESCVYCDVLTDKFDRPIFNFICCRHDLNTYVNVGICKDYKGVTNG